MQRQHPSLWKQLYCSGDNSNYVRDSITPRIVRQRDPAWKHCKVHPEDEAAVICKVCDLKLSCGDKGNKSIGAFKKHIQRKHGSLWNQLYGGEDTNTSKSTVRQRDPGSRDDSKHARDSITPRIVRQRDPAWKHCKVHPEDEATVICNICDVKIQIGANIGHFKRHIQIKHASLWNKLYGGEETNASANIVRQ